MCLLNNSTLKYLSHNVTTSEILTLRKQLIDNFPYDYETDTVNDFDCFVSFLRGFKINEGINNQKFLFDEYLLDYICSDNYGEALKLYVTFYYISQDYLDVPESLSRILVKILSHGLTEHNSELLVEFDNLASKIICKAETKHSFGNDIYYYIFLSKLILAKYNYVKDNRYVSTAIDYLDKIVNNYIENTEYMLTDDSDDWEYLIANAESKDNLGISLKKFLPSVVNAKIKDYEATMFGIN